MALGAFSAFNLKLWDAVSPDRVELTEDMAELVSELAAEVGQWSARVAGEGDARGLLFYNLEGDPFGDVSYPLRERIWKAGSLLPMDRSLFEKVRDYVGWTIPVYEPGPELARNARSKGAPLYLCGRVTRFSQMEERAELAVLLELRESARGAALARKEFRVGRGLLVASAGFVPDSFGFSLSLVERFALWLLVFFCAPFATLLLGRDFLSEASNATMVLIWFCLSIGDGALGLFLLRSVLEGVVGGLSLLVLLIVCFLYNYLALGLIRKAIFV